MVSVSSLTSKAVKSYNLTMRMGQAYFALRWAKGEAVVIHILVAAHAKVGVNILLGAEFILGQQERTHSIEYQVGDNLNLLKMQFQEVFDGLGEEDSLLIFIDLYGGSLCNVAASFMSKLSKRNAVRCECISGVNLPMVLYALENRDREECGLVDLKEECLNVGLGGIQDIKAEFRL